MRKKVYFVRHGESEGNAGDLRGHADHALTERGHRQAQFIAKRCTALPIEAMVVSTMLRARETAAHISALVGLEPTFSSLFVEAHGPSEFQNLPREHEEAKQFDALQAERFEDPQWRFSDEESFEDLKSRAVAALALLEDVTEEHVLVVTHGYFMRMLLARVVMGAGLSAREFRGFARTFHMENTGLTIFVYDDSKPQPWWLWVWNDHAHLAQ